MHLAYGPFKVAHGHSGPGACREKDKRHRVTNLVNLVGIVRELKRMASQTFIQSRETLRAKPKPTGLE